MAELMPAGHPECVGYAAELLRRGELVCYPTDTVYGIGAAAGNDAAVRRLFAVKGRRPDNPLPLLISDTASASFVAEASPAGQALMARFWPGGLTIVMRKRPEFRSAALAGRDTVGLRVPDCDVIRDIVRALGEPVTGTSANRSGARPPVSASEAALSLGEMVALVIDGGRAPGGVESTVIDITDERPRLVREGAVGRAEIEEVVKLKVEN